MQIVHTAHGDEVETGKIATDWLEVRRGQTRFPRRPLKMDRFLIGSGTNCHLQLGGGMPMLHCVLIRDQGAWTVQAIAAEPALFVNGCECRFQTLQYEDSLSIADFEFVLFRDAARPRKSRRDESVSSDFAVVPRPGAADQWTATDLADHLQQEIELVEHYEHRPTVGAKALLRAIRRHAAMSCRAA